MKKILGLLPIVLCVTAAAQNDSKPTAVLEADQGGPFALEENVKGLDVGAHGQVGARHGRAQKRRGGAVPPALPLRNLIGSEPLLRGSVEIGIALEAGFLRRLHEGLR